MVQTIELQGKKYPIKFGYGAFRNLGFVWDCKGVQGVAKKFQDIFPEGGSDDVSFEQADKLGDLAIAGLEAAGNHDHPERDDVVQELLFNPEKLEKLMQLFTDSFPKGNPQPRKNPGKKAKK